jgi:hypothetical protein
MKLLGLDHIGIVVRDIDKTSLGRATPLTAESLASVLSPTTSTCKF